MKHFLILSLVLLTLLINIASADQFSVAMEKSETGATAIEQITNNEITTPVLAAAQSPDENPDPDSEQGDDDEVPDGRTEVLPA